MCSTLGCVRDRASFCSGPTGPRKERLGEGEAWEGEALQGWAELPGQTQEGRTECAGRTASG